MIDIYLDYNDERLGFVDDQRSLVYPQLDVFGKSILTRTAMQVVWVMGERFVCFPPHMDTSEYRLRFYAPFYLDSVDSGSVNRGELANLSQATLNPVNLFQGSTYPAPEIAPLPDFGADGDRDAEDAPPVDLSTLTKAELIEIGAARGITLSERMTKQAMIDALS